MTAPATILVADDEGNLRKILSETLRQKGFHVLEAADGAQALSLLEGQSIQLALLDIKMPHLSGLELLEKIRSRGLKTAVIILTAFDTMRHAIEAMKQGAFDYLPKPFDLEQLEIQVQKALETQSLRLEVESLRQELKEREGGVQLVGKGRAMGEVYKTMGRVAASDVTVLITGESGTGKEMVARAIHAASPRTAGPFIAVNCAAIPRELLESELFGHTRGAFTGAVGAKKGMLQSAQGGTLLLDEIGDMSLELQAKILRVIQEREVQRLGENTPSPIDVRLLAATNQDLTQLVRERRFREDLYFRLNVVQIRVPPLRERAEDIPLLARHFLHQLAREAKAPLKTLTPEALARLADHSWPGNVRELANCVKRCAVLGAGDVIGPEAVKHHLTEQAAVEIPQDLADTALEEIIRRKLKMFLDRLGHYDPENLYEGIMGHVERPLLELILARAGANQIRAAKILGLNRNTLRKKIKALGIDLGAIKKVKK